MPLRDYAEAEKARLTPTLVFYGADGQRLLRIVGFYPPEKFSRVLDYVAGGHYARGPLSEYLRARAAAPRAAAKLEFDYSLFARPPHVLARTDAPATRPLVVVFDQAGCAGCERFRERVLSDAGVRRLLARFDAVQLDRADSLTTIVDPAGRSVTPAQWARELELAYEPSVVFFDERGAEVHRLDAETGRDRMTGSLQYVLEKAYLEHQQFLRWRRATGREAGAGAQRP
jgi:thioredoxin-related protein